MKNELFCVVYKNEKAKYNAIAEDIKERQEKGQPVLVGTVSIERSETIGRALSAAKITTIQIESGPAARVSH